MMSEAFKKRFQMYLINVVDDSILPGDGER